MSDYNKYYLKFADRAEMETVYRQPSEEDEGITYPGCIVDEVGRIVATPGEYDEDGSEITPPILAEGWHVNVASKGELPEELQPFEIEAPATPARVWA